MTHPNSNLRDSQTDTEVPADGFGAGFLEYSIRTSFRDLCRMLGKPQARQVVAEIVNDEFEGKRQ